MNFLRSQLYQAIGIQERDLQAQIHETLRSIKLFSVDESKELLRSMIDDYRSRSVYVNYLLKNRETILHSIFHQDRLLLRIQRFFSRTFGQTNFSMIFSFAAIKNFPNNKSSIIWSKTFSITKKIRSKNYSRDFLICRSPMKNFVWSNFFSTTVIEKWPQNCWRKVWKTNLRLLFYAASRVENQTFVSFVLSSILSTIFTILNAPHKSALCAPFDENITVGCFFFIHKLRSDSTALHLTVWVNTVFQIVNSMKVSGTLRCEKRWA